jgi:hypothetical protein
MEIAKSGSNLYVTDSTFTSSINSVSYFKLISEDSSSFLERTFDGEITSCDASSNYKFSSNEILQQSDTSFKLPDICVQVLIKPVNISVGQFTAKTYYEMTVKAAYTINEETKLVTFKSNRYEPFQTVQR